MAVILGLYLGYAKEEEAFYAPPSPLIHHHIRKSGPLETIWCLEELNASAKHFSELGVANTGEQNHPMK